MTETYKRVGEAALKFWPLLILQFLIGILRYGALAVVLIFTFGFMVLKYLNALMNNPKTFDWMTFANDWQPRLTDWSWLAGILAFVLLYTLWWSLLSAVWESGTFGSFWAYFRDEEGFSTSHLWADIRRFTVPMLWLQFLLSLCFIPALIIFGIGMGLIPVLWISHAVSFGVALFLSLLIGFPFLLLFVVFCFWFVVFCQTSKAYLTGGMEVLDAMRAAFQASRVDGWHIVKAGVLILVLYVVSSWVIQGFFSFFGLIPFFGFLFVLSGAFVSMALGMAWAVYQPALYVALVQQKES